MTPRTTPVAVVGVGVSELARRTQRPLGAFAMEAAQRAAADSGLSLDVIDGLATYPAAPFRAAANVEGVDVLGVEFFLARPEIADVSWYSEAKQGMIVASVSEAAHAIAAGACTYALVWRAMYVPPGRYGHAPENAVGGDEQFSAPYGVGSIIQWHALAYRRYLESFGYPGSALADFAVNSRRNAALNPWALMADVPMSSADYEQAPLVADPLRLFDCDIPVTGCVALILTDADRARDTAHAPAYLLGTSQQTARQPLLHYALQDHMEPAAAMVRRLWARTGIGPDDVDVAQLYDGFGPSAVYWLEAAGFCGRGEGLAFVREGRIALDGDLPVNTFGGSLSAGRLHGMGHIAEAVLQVGKRAGARQVDDADVVAVFDGSPMHRGGGLVFASAA